MDQYEHARHSHLMSTNKEYEDMYNEKREIEQRLEIIKRELESKKSGVAVNITYPNT